MYCEHPFLPYSAIHMFVLLLLVEVSNVNIAGKHTDPIDSDLQYVWLGTISDLRMVSSCAFMFPVTDFTYFCYRHNSPCLAYHASFIFENIPVLINVLLYALL